MAVPFDPTDPHHLTPDQRLAELIAILATGARRAVILCPIPRASESDQNPLDVSAQTSVHVPVRLTQTESAEGVEA